MYFRDTTLLSRARVPTPCSSLDSPKDSAMDAATLRSEA